MRKIKAIVYGLGAMGKIGVRLMVEKEVEIVGAIGNVSNIGKDVGEIAGLGYPLNVALSKDADAVLSKQKADIVFMAQTGGDIPSMYPHLKKCIEHGLNVITIGEEALYPWTSYPDITAELDRLAKQHGVTVCGSGVPDIFCVELVSVLSGACHTISLVKGEANCNIDDYGQAIVEMDHIGETREEYIRKRDNGEIEISNPFKIAFEGLAADLGLTVTKTSSKIEPLTPRTEIFSKSLKRAIKKNEVIGRAQTDIVETKEGVQFQFTFTAKVFEEGEIEAYSWLIKGEPDVYLENKHVPGQMATCTQAVNRIPDVLNSEPGFLGIDKLPKLKYRAYPLHHYLKNQ